MSFTTEIILDPVESSRLAGLRYVSDAKPGITRKRRGKSFQYFDPEGIAKAHALHQEEVELMVLLDSRLKAA